jgi:hypothetical protein
MKWNLFRKETDEEWLAEYLRLEYGESWFSFSSLKARHLKYLGEHTMDGIPTKYWSYPTSDGHSWVTIQEFGGENRCASTTEVPPPSVPNGNS